LELTNEENTYYGYSRGAHQFRYPRAHKWGKCLLQILAHQFRYPGAHKWGKCLLQIFRRSSPIQISWSSHTRKIPNTDIQEELTNSGILELTNKESSGYEGGAQQFRYLGAHKWRKFLLKELRRSSPILSWSSQLKKMSTPDIQEELTISDILELTNEENTYFGSGELTS
jgi:hypothetical protein